MRPAGGRQLDGTMHHGMPMLALTRPATRRRDEPVAGRQWWHISEAVGRRD